MPPSQSVPANRAPESGRNGNSESERAPLTCFARNIDGAALSCYELLYDGQSETRASRLTRPRSLRAIEAIEYVGKVLGIDA